MFLTHLAPHIAWGVLCICMKLPLCPLEIYIVHGCRLPRILCKQVLWQKWLIPPAAYCRGNINITHVCLSYHMHRSKSTCCFTMTCTIFVSFSCSPGLGTQPISSSKARSVSFHSLAHSHPAGLAPTHTNNVAMKCWKLSWEGLGTRLRFINIKICVFEYGDHDVIYHNFAPARDSTISCICTY